MTNLRYIVTDVDRSVAFYQKHFGFALRKLIGSAIANVAKDDLSLWLSGPESSAGKPLSDRPAGSNSLFPTPSSRESALLTSVLNPRSATCA